MVLQDLQVQVILHQPQVQQVQMVLQEVLHQRVQVQQVHLQEQAVHQVLQELVNQQELVQQVNQVVLQELQAQMEYQVTLQLQD